MVSSTVLIEQRLLELDLISVNTPSLFIVEIGVALLFNCYLLTSALTSVPPPHIVIFRKRASVLLMNDEVSLEY